MGNDFEIIIGTKVDNSGLEKGLKETEKISKDFDNKSKVKVDVELNTKVENEIKKIKDKFDKYGKNKLVISEINLNDEDALKRIKDMKDTYQDLAKQAEEIGNTRDTTGDIIGEVINFEKLTEQNKQDIETINSLRRELTEKINLQYENIKAMEQLYPSIINSEKKLTEEKEKQNIELQKQISKNETIKRQLTNQKKLSSGSISKLDLSGINNIGESSLGDEAKNIGGVLDKLKSAFTAIGSIGKSALSVAGSILGKVVSIGAKIFGITSIIGLLGIAFGVVVKAIQKVIEENKQLVANIKYLIFVISTMLGNAASGTANVIANILSKIIQFLVSIIRHIAYIVNMLFHIDLLAGTSADDFRKSQEATAGIADNLASGASSAKEIRKQLAGFDEMNVIGDNVNTAGGGGGASGAGGMSDFTMPDISLGDKISEWVVKLTSFFDILRQITNFTSDEIPSAIAGVTGALILMKLLGLDPIKGLGIGLMLYGFIELLKDTKKYIDDLNPSLENSGTSFESFGEIVGDVGLIVLGLGILCGNLPLIIAGAILTIISLLYKNWDKIKKWIDKDVVPKINKTADKLEDKGHKVLAEMTRGIGTYFEDTKITTGNLLTAWKEFFDGIGLIFKGEKDGWKTMFEGLINIIIGGINNMIDALNITLIPLRAVIVAIAKATNQDVSMDIIKVPHIPPVKLKTGAIINQPGKGVPVGGAIAGEAGREGILPLTDSRAMEQLGKEIGKWITLNANIPVSIGNRQIAREIRQVMAQDDFAMNN